MLSTLLPLITPILEGIFIGSLLVGVVLYLRGDGKKAQIQADEDASKALQTKTDAVKPIANDDLEKDLTDGKF